MNLAVDIGNTNIKIGVFDEEKLISSYRVASDISHTADEYGITILNLLSSSGILPDMITGSIISSVIPQLNYTIEHMITYYFNVKPLFVGVGIKSGLNVRYDNPYELGSDRIINSVAAINKYGAPFILIDFGTATTFNVVNEKGEFIGGCITLGVKSAVESLASSTAKLPNVEIVQTKSAICRSTVKNIQSGIYYSVIGQIKEITRRIKKEMKYPEVKVIATGGLSEVFVEECDIDIVDRGLSLEGLNILYLMNKDNE